MTEVLCDFGDGNEASYHIHEVVAAPKKRDTWLVCKENFHPHMRHIRP